MHTLRQLFTVALVALLAASCVSAPDEDDPTPDAGGDVSGTPATSDAGSEPGVDAGRGTDTNTPADTTYRYVLIEDMTPVGQGLALDAVEACNQLGQACVGLTEVVASSDETLDYAGATNGANAQDDSCTEESFTRLAGTPNWVILGFADENAVLESPMKLNAWTGQSQCPLVEAGDKAFDVSVGNSTDRTSFTAIDSCLGTCTLDL